MKAAEIPHHFNVNMEPKEFDELLLMARIYVRDYEVSELAEHILGALEEAATNREVGGQIGWTPPGWDEDSPEEMDGGVLVPSG
jgi:hypothetical protein